MLKNLFILFTIIFFMNVLHSQNIELAGGIPGTINRIAAGDSTVFCASNNGLMVLKTTSDQFYKLAYLPLGASCNSIILKNTEAYVLASEQGLQIIDVNNPENPFVTGQYLHPSAYQALGFSIDNQVAAIAFGMAGIYYINISNPSNPLYISHYQNTNQDYYHDVAIYNGYCYAATGNKIHIINISNTALPVYTAQLSVQGEITDMDISGTKLIVLSNYNDGVDQFYGTTMVNIANPQNPVKEGTYSTTDYCYDISIVNDTCFLAAGSNGVYMLKLLQNNFNLICSFDNFSSHVISVTGKGNKVLVSAEKQGLWGYSLIQQSPVYLANFQVLYDCRDVAVGNNSFAILADGRAGLKMIDISNPHYPQIAASASNNGNGLSLALNGNYAYLADGGQGLKEYRITSPEQLAQTGQVATTGWVQDLVVQNSIGYLAMDVYGVQLANLALPGLPSLAGNYFDLPGTSYGIDVSGNIIYVAAASAGLRIINAAVPLSLQEISSVQTNGQAYDVYVDGTKAYVACSNGGFSIIDVASPATPQIVSSVNPGGDIRQIVVKGNYAYLADWNNKIWIYNISNPALPVMAANFQLSYSAHNIALYQQYILVANGSAGLNVLTNPFDTGTPVHEFTADYITAYPNPCNNKLTIITQNENITWFRLYNSSGQLVISKPFQNNKQFTIDTENLPDGIYFALMKNDKNWQRQKIIISHQ